MVIYLVVIQTSCKKEWLEIKSDKQQAIPVTLKDFQAVLDYTYIMNFNEIALGEIASDGHYVTESAWSSATSGPARNAYTWSHDQSYSKLFSFELTYQRIFYSNLVLDGLPNINTKGATEQDSWNNIKGQALFNRAEAFFALAQLYAQPYNTSTAATDLGIPIRLNSNITIQSTRSTVKETYDQIINDLKQSASLLPVTPVYLTRGSKPAVYGLLARTYLVMNNYDSALFYADKTLQLKSTLIDYNALDPSNGYVGLFNSEVLFHVSLFTDEMDDFVTYNCFIDPSLYASYDADDLRSLFFTVNPDNTISFWGNYNDNEYELFSGIAVDEIYLIRAECYARKGNMNSAMTDLNNLRKKRWNNSVAYPVLTAINSDDALVKILNERKKELVLRNLRWSDLRRLNKDDRFKITLTRTIGGNTYTVEPNSYKYTFPIPVDVIQLSGMPQTPGW